MNKSIDATPLVAERVKRKLSVTEQLCVQRRSLSLQGFVALKTKNITNDSIKYLGVQKSLKVLKFGRDTDISSLEELPPQPNLAEIMADGTKLADYKGLPGQKSLAIISAMGTPLAARKEFRTEVLIMCGQKIRMINGEEVKMEERVRASRYPLVCREFIMNGWEPGEIEPDEDEIIELMKKFLPAKFKAVEDGSMSDDKLQVLMSPPRSLTGLLNSRQEQYTYYGWDDNRGLVDSLVEVLDDAGIHVEYDDNIEENLLGIIDTLGTLSSQVANEVDRKLE